MARTMDTLNRTEDTLNPTPEDSMDTTPETPTRYRHHRDDLGRPIKGLLTSPEANPKTAKGRARGYATYVMHLAPARESGYQTCPAATKGCAEACLFNSGRASFDPGINRARIRRTEWFFEHRGSFMRRLHREMELAVARETDKGNVPVFRLNGTSDIRWETVPVTTWDGRTFGSLFEAFPDVQFYDYTKLPNRRNLPANYHLTYSLAESNGAWAAKAAEDGLCIAVVFRDDLPDTFELGAVTLPVVDGDADDLRFLDGTGVVVGLKAKGPAKADESGFVHDTNRARVDLPVLDGLACRS